MLCTDYGGYLDLVGEGYMGSMQWQLGREMGTIPAFASRTQEMSGVITLLPLYALMVRTAITLPSLGPTETRGSLKDTRLMGCYP